MLKKLRLILLQLFTENIINPIWFRIVKWYEQRLVKLIEVEDEDTTSTTDVSNEIDTTTSEQNEIDTDSIE